MKIHLEYISACALLLSMISCKDTLDTNPSSSFTEEVVWNSYSTADAFVNGTYVAVLTGTGLAGSGNFHKLVAKVLMELPQNLA